MNSSSLDDLDDLLGNFSDVSSDSVGAVIDIVS
jgi:hypothetical protein